MKKHYGLWAVIGLAAAGCNMDAIKGGMEKGSEDAQASHSSMFANKGNLCGTYVSFGGYKSGAKSDAGKQMDLTVALGICGEIEGKEWKALAVTETTSEVTVNAGDKASTSNLFLDDKSVMMRKVNGKYQKIGTIANDDIGDPVKLLDGVSVQILVAGEPFDLDQHSKLSEGKTVVVTTTAD